MRHCKSWFVALLLCAVVVAPAAASGFASVGSERSNAGEFDAAGFLASQRALADRLTASRAGTALPISIQLTAEDRASVAMGEPGERRLKVGVVKSVGMPVDFADLRQGSISTLNSPRLFGAVRSEGDGFVWSGAVRSDGASALRLHLTELNLPDGVELYVYNGAGQAYGPYTGRGPLGTGEFWTHTVFGEQVELQLRYKREMQVQTLASTHFVLDEVAHLGDRFLLPRRMQQPQGSGLSTRAFCSFNESCVENANCGSTSSAVNDARDGVAHILFRSGGSFFICSGGLLNDTDTSSQRPLFLTANHCISKGREASSMEAFFLFDTPCGGSCYNPDGAVPSTLGASILSTNRTSDYTLMELNQSAPAGTTLMGWTSAAVANSNGTALFRISHPSGSPQAYSEHDVDTGAGTCSSWPRGNWIYSEDIYGATEGGSSGSPVVNGSGQVVGQLSGACGTNVNDTCDSVNNATVDGALSAYFSQVDQYLDPGSGGPTCSPVGASCSGNSDCCSNKCRGRRGNKTCR